MRRVRLLSRGNFSRSLVGLAIGGSMVLAGAQAAGASHMGKVLTVAPTTELQLAGTDIYCTVIKESVGAVVACFHDPGGPSSSVRKGYAIAAGDPGVAVEPPKSTKPIVQKAQPSFAKIAVFSKGTASGTKVITMSPGDIAAVGGTHMAIAATTGAKGGGSAIGVAYLDAQDNFIVGSYAIGISNSYVTISKIASATKTTVAYRHSVY